MKIKVKQYKSVDHLFVRRKKLSAEICICPLSKLQPTDVGNTKHTGVLKMDKTCGGVISANVLAKYKFSKDSIYGVWFDRRALNG